MLEGNCVGLVDGSIVGFIEGVELGRIVGPLKTKILFLKISKQNKDEMIFLIIWYTSFNEKSVTIM